MTVTGGWRQNLLPLIALSRVSSHYIDNKFIFILTYSLRNLLQVKGFEYILTNTTALFVLVFLSIQPRKEQVVSCVSLRAPTQAEKSNSLPNEVGPTHNA